MKTKDFISLAKELLPIVPGFAIKGPIMFARPVGHLLRGLCFEDSGFDAKAFYVWVFFLPLCVPTRYISFNLGKRIRGQHGERWSADAPNVASELGIAIKNEALPFLSRVESIRDVAVVAASLLTPQDIHIQQAIAYASARGGNVHAAKELLGQFLHQIDSTIPWQHEMAERAKSLQKHLNMNPVEAQQQLETWEAETIKNLGLESYR